MAVMGHILFGVFSGATRERKKGSISSPKTSRCTIMEVLCTSITVIYDSLAFRLNYFIYYYFFLPNFLLKFSLRDFNLFLVSYGEREVWSKPGAKVAKEVEVRLRCGGRGDSNSKNGGMSKLGRAGLSVWQKPQ